MNSVGKKSDISPAKKITAYACTFVLLGMFGVAYAAVPLYQWFCSVTGYGGTTQVSLIQASSVIERRIKVRFDANVSPNLNWAFEPERSDVEMNIGETSQAAYSFRNLGKTASIGTSTFNVTPLAAGAYFNKLECFCFTEQRLEGGESVSMPVVFFIDPDIANDPDLATIDTITLSYTFFPVEEATPAVDENS